MMYQHLPEKKVEELVNANLRYQFEDLARRFPDSFVKAYGKPPSGNKEESEKWWNAQCASALRQGHKVYVAEGCWHCHSQFVRPVSNEERRWGPVAKTEEYQNELQRPVLFGTRRVGPDLSREGDAAAATGMPSTSSDRRTFSSLSDAGVPLVLKGLLINRIRGGWH